MLTHQFYPTVMDFTVNNMDLTHTFPNIPPELETHTLGGSSLNLSHLPFLDNIKAREENDRRRTTASLARSPDLTPPDFFFWGYMKDQLYSWGSATTDHHLDRLEAEGGGSAAHLNTEHTDGDPLLFYS